MTTEEIAAERLCQAMTKASEQILGLKNDRDKLLAFKNWVHAYLDAHGVPHHPPGTHGAAGCRVGDRMDWLMARCEAAESNCSVAQKGWQQTLDDLMKVADGFKTAQEQIRRLRESLLWAMGVIHESGCVVRPSALAATQDILKETSQ